MASSSSSSSVHVAVKKKKLFIFSSVLLLLISAFPSSSQAREKAGYRYPFIRKASSVSQTPSSASSPPSSSAVGSGAADKTYDYIVVGGGTAGCPLAATLSKNYTVLLLERGGVPFNNYNVSFLKNFHLTLADLSPTSASQYFVSTDGVFNSRARVLGGGSSINAGFYTRASSRYIQTEGWDEKLVNESYPWVEKQIVFKPTDSEWQAAIKDGLLDAGVSPYNGFTYDHIYGTKFGGTIFDRFGRRHTSAELLASADSKNIDVLIHATTQKILFDTRGKKPRAVGVLFQDEYGNEHHAFLSKNLRSEIIVSCGAIGSPQLLMLSGIGPKDELRKFNITPVLINENVGKDMADNPMNTVYVPFKKHVEQSLIEVVGITKKGVYIEASNGFSQNSSTIHCHHGIMSAEIGQLSTIPPEKRTVEAIKSYATNKKDLPYEAFMGGFILQKIAYPLSKGDLKLNTTNIDENPLVTFNYFQHPQDLRKCVKGMEIIKKVVRSEPFKNFTQCDQSTVNNLFNLSVSANVNLIPRHANDSKFMAQFCKDTVVTIWHYHGGCHVNHVVDMDRKVLGVTGLRIVDGSTFKDSPGTNPQGTVMMMGRYYGVKILRERLGSAAGE
uniref:Glucose-methanol-choline oxidoreductase N-terminal domain-containing protein n=1 Tax=Kalanchoe fedtschenkoi TaxID=63787 RepID=A0A7N0UYB5_KALFE